MRRQTAQNVSLANRLPLKGRNIQYRLFITSANKTEPVFGAIVHFFPRQKPLLATCSWAPEQGTLLQGINEQDAFASIIQQRV